MGLMRKLYKRIPPVLAHDIAIAAAHYIQGDSPLAEWIRESIHGKYAYEDGRLRVTLPALYKMDRMEYRNPIGLAAGVDKNGRAVDFFHMLGFGFVEVGSVTQNPIVREREYFRLPGDQALINRAKLRNEGVRELAKNLVHQKAYAPVGINITADSGKAGTGKDDAIKDIINSFTACRWAARFIVLNISCPNTADGRAFQDPQVLDELRERVMYENQPNDLYFSLWRPILVKLSPDLSDKELEKIVETCERHHVNGYVLTNTTQRREGLGLKSPLETVRRIGSGGLSGLPLQQMALDMTKKVYRLTGGKAPIIGVGGIMDAESAYARIRAGASLLEIYTMMVYRMMEKGIGAGLGAAYELKTGLVRLMQRDGVRSISEIVGADAQGNAYPLPADIPSPARQSTAAGTVPLSR